MKPKAGPRIRTPIVIAKIIYQNNYCFCALVIIEIRERIWGDIIFGAAVPNDRQCDTSHVVCI